MNENPYRPPEAVVTAAGHRPGSPLKAIAVATAVNVGGSLLAGLVIGIAAGIYFAAAGYSDQQISGALTRNHGVMMVYFLTGLFFSLWAGYLCARIANINEYRHAFITGVIGLLIGELVFAIDPPSRAALPGWYLYASYLLYLPTVLLGAFLWVRRKSTG